MYTKNLLSLLLLAGMLFSCGANEQKTGNEDQQISDNAASSLTGIDAKLAKYTSVKLTSDFSGLSEKQRQMIPIHPKP